MDLDDRNGVSNATWDVDEEGKLFEGEDKLDNYKSLGCVHVSNSLLFLFFGK